MRVHFDKFRHPAYTVLSGQARLKNHKENTDVNQYDLSSLTPGERSCAPRCDGSVPHGCAEDTVLDTCLTGKSLAMVYSPCQMFEGLYTPEEGLCRGTVFMELEKPFWGARRMK